MRAPQSRGMHKDRQAEQPITLGMSERELYALGIWFVDAVAPKGVTEKRTFMTAIEELELDGWMDKAEPTDRCTSCGNLKRTGLMEVDAAPTLERTLTGDVVKYLLKELDPEDKANARGNAVRILFRLTERLRELRTAPRPKAAQPATEPTSAAPAAAALAIGTED